LRSDTKRVSQPPLRFAPEHGVTELSTLRRARH
jgi:hypothetical protein